LVSKVSKEIVSLVADKISKLESRVDGVDAKVDKLTTSVEQMQKQLHEMALQGSKPMSQGTNGSFPKASEPTPTVFNTTVFFRVPDPTVLFCNTEHNVKVARPNFHASILQLALEVGLDSESFDLVGDPLDDKFEINFKGSNHDDIKSKTLQFYSSLMLRKGVWKKQAVLDDKSKEIRFFVNPDKNGAQIRREVLTKLLQDLVQNSLAGKEVWAKKPTGTLFVDRRRLCVLHITSEEGFSIEWMHDKRIQLKLDEATISESFKAAVAAKMGQSS
jgi:hypothetical protein